VLSRVAHRHAERRGTDTAPPLKTAGLTAELIADQSATIGVANQIRFVELVAAVLGDGLFGFHLTDNFDPRELVCCITPPHRPTHLVPR